MTFTAQVTLDGYEIRIATVKALGIIKSDTDGWPMTFLPRSQVECGDELDVGDTDLVVPQWLAEKEGLDFGN